ncbi:hypothetical protein U0035_22055 [Niabella yanshanensis]|uniref:Uncharacterized protein n=1 Tax=Niabella yanshanensis TaxID=577386 RepID=A0ABZ0W596_9BACT|nr:hypothetical protein [Niabella yanshanensis]WQD38361.1 hypothetical protein U0035_22055 [Niabella yanshanensis]
METINAGGVNTIEESVTPITVVINEAVEKGFDLIFRLKEDGSLWDQNGIYYDPEQMTIAYSRVVNEAREDTPGIRLTTIYLLRNEEGDKGILVDADGIYGDRRIDSFIRNISRLQQPVSARQQKSWPAKRLVWAAAGLLLITSALSFKLISRGK